MKNVRHTHFTVILLTLITLTSPAFAGPGAEGNGSGILPCHTLPIARANEKFPTEGEMHQQQMFVQNRARNKIDAEENRAYIMVDLWEATKPQIFSRNGLTIDFSNASVDAQRVKALRRLEESNPVLYKKVLAKQAQIHANIIDLDEGDGFAKPSDLDMLYYPTSQCDQPIGIARWDSTRGFLFLDRHRYKLMAGRTHQAAMWLHEYIYAVLEEEFGAETSFLARLITGYLFSTVDPRDFPFRESNWFFTAESTYGTIFWLHSVLIVPNPLSPMESYKMSYGISPQANNHHHCVAGIDFSANAASPGFHETSEGNLRSHQWHNRYSDNLEIEILSNLDRPKGVVCEYQILLNTIEGKDMLEDSESDMIRFLHDDHSVSVGLKVYNWKTENPLGGKQYSLSDIGIFWSKQY